MNEKLTQLKEALKNMGFKNPVIIITEDEHATELGASNLPPITSQADGVDNYIFPPVAAQSIQELDEPIEGDEWAMLPADVRKAIADAETNLQGMNV